ISRFLAQGMDSLLDADELLQQWQQQQDPAVLQGLRRDLQDVAAGAAEAEVPHIQLLAEVLNELYQRIEDEQASPEEGLLALASDAHEEMLTLMDCLAAGQETQRPEALLERLRTWEFIDAAAPEADDHTTLADAFTAGDDTEEIDFSAFDLAAEDTAAEDTAAEDTAAGTEVIPADDWAADELTLEAEPAAVPDWLSDDHAAPEAEELTAEDVLAEDVLAEDVLAEDVLAEDITLAESPAAADDDSIDDEILEIFLEEAQEIGESVETALLRWRENPDDLLQVAQLQRELHTLKGGARMAEIAAVADLCHELETLYENV